MYFQYRSNRKKQNTNFIVGLFDNDITVKSTYAQSVMVTPNLQHQKLSIKILFNRNEQIYCIKSWSIDKERNIMLRNHIWRNAMKIEK